MELAAVVAAGVVLVTLWAVTNRRHLARREPQSADWDATDDELDLWTSAARCVHCGTSGGLLEKDGDRLFFACLSCGRRHERDSRG